MDLIPLTLLDVEGQEVDILINPNAIVSIEKINKEYAMHLVDGRTFRMTKKQYAKQFVKIVDIVK